MSIKFEIISPQEIIFDEEVSIVKRTTLSKIKDVNQIFSRDDIINSVPVTGPVDWDKIAENYHDIVDMDIYIDNLINLSTPKLLQHYL